MKEWIYNRDVNYDIIMGIESIIKINILTDVLLLFGFVRFFL